jgi:hypothetical protein
MARIVRLTESDLTRLVKRVIKEDETEIESVYKVPDCMSLMQVSRPDMIGSSPELKLPSGCKIERFSDGGPKYLSYKIVCNGKRFCQIMKDNF